MKYDIITVGSGVVDAFMMTGLEEKEGNILIPTGSKILVEDLWFATGGGGTNSAATFSRMGLKTGFMGKLGKDENGKMILRELKMEGVAFLGRKGKDPTGYSVVIDSKKGNRSLIFYPGANNSFSFRDVKTRWLKTNWLYFSSMVGESLKMQEKLAVWAKKKGIRIAYNPSSYLTKKGGRKLKNIIRHCTILVLNKEEARDLVKSGDLFEGLGNLGPEIICVTDGKKGNYVYDRRNIYHSIPNDVKVKERTGAGDAFAAGFVTGIIKLRDVKQAMQIGSMNAEAVIQKLGAKNGILKWESVEKGLKNDLIRIRRRVC